MLSSLAATFRCLAVASTGPKAECKKSVQLRTPKPVFRNGEARIQWETFHSQEELETYLSHAVIVDKTSRKMVTSFSRLQGGQTYDYFPVYESIRYGEIFKSDLVTIRQLDFESQISFI